MGLRQNEVPRLREQHTQRLEGQQAQTPYGEVPSHAGGMQLYVSGKESVREEVRLGPWAPVLEGDQRTDGRGLGSGLR